MESKLYKKNIKESFKVHNYVKVVKEKVYFPYTFNLKGLAIHLMVMGHTVAWAFNENSFFHQPMFQLSDSDFLRSNHDGWTTNLSFAIVYSIITSSVAIFISLIVSKFISASEMLHKLLFGK